MTTQPRTETLVHSTSLFDYWLTTYWYENGDPRINNFPLIGTFKPFLCILTVYAVFVLYIGPKWMQNRKPFSLKKIMLFYNLSMTLINAYFFLRMLMNFDETWSHLFDVKFPLSFSKPTERESEIIFECYLYLITKIIDLLDTVFFVLRKKQSQVTGKCVFFIVIIYLKLVFFAFRLTFLSSFQCGFLWFCLL